MPKKSHKPRWRKENIGCLRGLIDIFDICQVNSTQKLLIDKEGCSSRNLGEGIGDSRSKVDLPCYRDVGSAAYMTRIGAKNDNLGRQNYPHMSTIPSSGFDVDAFMLDYCSNSLHCECDQFECRNMTEKCNKQIFKKLLQDPNSSVRRHIRERHNAQFRKFFKPGRIRLIGELPGPKKLIDDGKDAKGLHRIVVLKPTRAKIQNISNTIVPIASISSHCNMNCEEDRERHSSQFSLKEIRKRLRNIIAGGRKEKNPIAKNPIAMDDIFPKIPYIEKRSRRSESSCRTEHIENREMRLYAKEIQKKREISIDSNIARLNKLNTNSAPRVLYTEAAFCYEAKKHLTEFLRMSCKNDSLPPIRISKSLGKITSYPVFDNLLPIQNFVPQEDRLDYLIQKKIFPINDKSHESSIEIVEVDEFEDKECIQIEKLCKLETKSELSNNEDHFSRALEEEKSSMQLERLYCFQEQPEAAFQCPIQRLEVVECAKEITDRLSPISPLESLCFEENISFTPSKIAEHVSSMPNWTYSEEGLITCTEFDEATMFDELEASYSTFIDDPKLLFDSIDEVVTEIKEKHLSCTPWVYSIKPAIWSVPKKEYFMKEACRRINWHLDVRFQNTLKEAVQKDLDGGIWIDFQNGAESMVEEIGDAILECLFEETALKLQF